MKNARNNSNTAALAARINRLRFFSVTAAYYSNAIISFQAPNMIANTRSEFNRAQSLTIRHSIFAGARAGVAGVFAEFDDA